jgi:hypothetical protein
MSKVRILSNLLDSSNDVAVSYLDNVTPYSLPTSSTTVLGGVKVGANLSISSGVLAGAAPYSKPSSEPISYITGLQTALNAKTTPAYVDTKVAALVASAPATLDTLNELALALDNDPNHVTTMTTLIGTKLPLAGGTMTGEVEFQNHFAINDNKEIRVGSGNDLKIYHDGINSRIWDVGVGGLFILASNSLTLGDAQGYDFITCTDEGAGGTVRLNHQSNATKLATTSSGIDVTGKLTTSTGVDTTGKITIYNTSGSLPATSGTTQVPTVLSLSGVGNQVLNVGTYSVNNAMWFQNNNPGALSINYPILFQPNGGNVGIGTTSPTHALHVTGNINTDGTVYITDPGISSGSINYGSGKMTIGMDSAGTDGIYFRSYSGGYADRVVIKSNGNVGIGTTSPDLKLDVSHGTGSEYVATFQNTSDNLELKIGTTTGGFLNIQGVTISANAAYNITLQADGGNVGIGTTTPSAKLHTTEFKTDKWIPELPKQTITGGFQSGCAINTWYNITNISQWSGYLGGYSGGNKGVHFEIFWTSGNTSLGYNHSVVGWVPPASSNTSGSYSTAAFVTHHSGSTMTSGVPITVHHHTSAPSSHNIQVRTANTGASGAPLQLQIFAATSPNTSNATITLWRA